MSIFQSIAAFCARLFGAKSPPSPPVIPMAAYATSWGINIHFTSGHASDLARIAKWGARFVRMDFDPTWSIAGYQSLIADATNAGLGVMLITPYLFRTPNGLNYTSVAYAGMMSTAASALANYPIIWEIMNEPNVSNGGSYAMQPAEFVAYLEAATAAIRSASGQRHTVLAGGTSGADLGWHQALAKLGMPMVDGVAIHPYGDSVAQLASDLQDVFDAYGGRFPVNVTEFGIKAATPSAETSLFAFLSAARGRVPRFVVYVYAEDGSGYGLTSVAGAAMATLPAVLEVFGGSDAAVPA